MAAKKGGMLAAKGGVVAKGGLTLAAKGGVVASGAAAFAARRAAWPVVAVGGTFVGGAWFGTFELTNKACTMVLPVPSKPEPGAQAAGLATIPVTTAVVAWAGWRFCPPLPAAPAAVFDVAGWARLLRGLPVSYVGGVGIASAAGAAIDAELCNTKAGPSLLVLSIAHAHALG
eukprot:CAMPEP_0183353262 /NCGR_PEP_ID=MMETSP0164_2-20130417/33156_1 /TAXON_ID=221442 /ORGANISM="Coccolithus pelagicus ssp braarudi, Strain PLY182g" /LENGTH=172 /DNA_ID=CAMNT_0025525913 /DNA_START=14 /DNA_END=533 /DNA_ORIENTATION=+